MFLKYSNQLKHNWQVYLGPCQNIYDETFCEIIAGTRLTIQRSRADILW